MAENLGVDGPIERYSRGLDTWVPLDSEGSFAAMRRSIDVQRKASAEGHTRARVLLRIKSAAKTDQAPATQTSASPFAIPLINLPGAGVPQPLSATSKEGARMSFRPFAPEPAPLNETVHQQSHQGPPLPPPPPPPPFNMPSSHMQGPEMYSSFRLPSGPPSGMQMPPPPPPPPAPFPFEHHRHGFLPSMSSMMPPPRPSNLPNGGFAPHSMPIPPLVPERPPLPMRDFQPEPRSSITPTQSTNETERTDSEMVMSILGELEEKMQLMGDKVDKIHVEEKKHYESLRRGLKRLKEDKSNASTFTIEPAGAPSEDRPMMTGFNYREDHPCCICNYCLKRITPPTTWLIVGDVVTYVMCKTCDNFTLCLDCFMSDKYHHHPDHAFNLSNPEPIQGTQRYTDVTERLPAGRGLRHRAHCDECKTVLCSRHHHC